MGPGDLFELDTKGICLLCLRNCSEDGQGISANCQPMPSTLRAAEKDRILKAFKVLMRYLNIDLLKQCNLSNGFLQQVDGFQREVQMVVKMCSVCLRLCQEFSQVYKQFEVVRLQLDECVQALHQAMISGEKDVNRVRDFEKTVMQESWNPLHLFHASVADNLRKETLRKCSMRVENLIPRVGISRPVSSYFADSCKTEPGYNTAFDDPICVITQTKGDLENDNDFAGPTSMLKVETEYFDGGSPNDNIFSIIQEDGTEIDPVNGFDVHDPFYNSNRNDLSFKQDPTFRPRGNKASRGGGSSSTGSTSCRHCRKKFFSQGNLRTHLVTVHTLEHYADRLPDGTTSSNLKTALEYCVNQFKRINNVHGIKRVMCGFCTKEARDTFNLRIHILDNHFHEVINALPENPIQSKHQSRVLSPIKASKTTKALKAFKRTGGRGRRRASVKSHTGPIYKCPVCKKDFTVLACMKRHHKIFHTREGGKKFSCDWCDKPFLTAFNVRLHVNTVHLMEAYQAQIPPGTTKVQLKALLNKIAHEQGREQPGLGSKSKVKCNLCGKLNSDAFFFKFHMVEDHFQAVISRLNEVEGEKGGEGTEEYASMNGESPEENKYEVEEEEEMSIDNFAHSNVVEVASSSLDQMTGLNAEEEEEEEENLDSQQDQVENTQDTLMEENEMHQGHFLSGLSVLNEDVNGDANEDENHVDDEDGGSFDLPPPVLEMYDSTT